jgi:cellulose synthase/poly-beta-1,6-N-acetylglucosamine synthase-like glycosyltransferase
MLNELIHVLLVAASAVLHVYLGVVCLFVLLVTVASWTRRRAAGAEALPNDPPRFLFVIPAHDEEAGIGATVASCLGVRYPRERFDVLAIADNCTDGTARAAAEAGAQVVERHDLQKRSKGYALEYLFAKLVCDGDAQRYDAVVVVDADTQVDPDLLVHFSRALAEGADWVQGYYSVSNADSSRRTRLMTYAFSLFNGVWLLGLDRLGLSVSLRGNGMGFTLRGLERQPWRAYGLTEDLEFSWLLRIAGERVRFLPEARVYGEMVSGGGAAAASQRQRWEVGRRDLRRAMAGPLARSSHLSVWQKLLAFLDLFMLPLSPLAALLVACLAVDGLLVATRGLPPALLATDVFHFAALALYCASPFLVLGLPARYLRDLVHVPTYALWKAVVALRKKPAGWVRTAREGRHVPSGG